MKSLTRDWLKAEGELQGLSLTEADLEAIYERVQMIKGALVALRPSETEGLDPPYRFVISIARS